MRRYAFIFNPKAGRVKSDSQIEQLKELVGSFPDSKLFCLTPEDNIGCLVKRLSSDYDIFVACGGDGTIREVAAVLINTNKIVGIIPMGTANDLCKTLKIPTNIVDAFDILRQGKTIEMDVGRCNNFIFLNSLGLGFDGLTNRYAHEFHKFPSTLQYVVAALKATVTHETFSVKIGNPPSHTVGPFIMISFANGRVEGGSFWIAPKASTTDNQFKMVTINPIYKCLIPLLLPLFLYKKGHWLPQVSITEINEIKLELSREVDIHADGEIIKTTSKLFEIDIIPNSLEIICAL